MEPSKDLFSNRPIFKDDYNSTEGKGKPKNKTQFMEMNKKLKNERALKKKEEDATIFIQKKFKKLSNKLVYLSKISGKKFAQLAQNGLQILIL